MRPGITASLPRFLLALALVSSSVSGAAAGIADADQPAPCAGEMAGGDCPHDCCGDECPPRECSGMSMAAVVALIERGTIDPAHEARTSAPTIARPSVVAAPLLRPPAVQEFGR